MTLDLRDLEAFLAVADAGSISRGAIRLHLAQPSVSERLVRLEGRVGRPVFDRSPRGVMLTAAGRRLLPYAERCLALSEEAVRAVQSDDARGRLHIMMHASFTPIALPFVLDAVDHLDLDVRCDDAHSGDVLTAIADGTADLGFVVPVPHPPAVVLRPCFDDPVICVVAPDHPLRTERRPRVADLATTKVAVNAWGEGADEFLDLLRAAPVPSTRLRLVSSTEAAAVLARRRGHAAVLTRSSVQANLSGGGLVELPLVDLPRWSVGVSVAYRRADARHAAIRAVRGAMPAIGTPP